MKQEYKTSAAQRERMRLSRQSRQLVLGDAEASRRECEAFYKALYTPAVSGRSKWGSSLAAGSQPAYRWVTRALSQASKDYRGFEVSISTEDIYCPEFCPVFGTRLEYGRTSPRDPAKPSLDRIDNRFGYVKGNVRIISWRANRLKWAATLEELEALVKYMSEGQWIV